MERPDKDQSRGILDEVNEQKKKFKALSFQKKIAYIYDYYKIPILIAVLAILILGSFIRTNLNRKNEILYVAMVNANSLTSQPEELENEFYDRFEINTQKDEIVLDTSMAIKEGFNDDISMVSAQKLLGLISTGSLDCMVCEPFVVDYYAEDGAYMNLDKFLPKDLIQKLKENDLIYESKDENGDLVPTGINVSNSLKLLHNKLYEANQPIYMVFSRSSKNTDMAKNFFDFLSQDK